MSVCHKSIQTHTHTRTFFKKSNQDTTLWFYFTIWSQDLENWKHSALSAGIKKSYPEIADFMCVWFPLSAVRWHSPMTLQNACKVCGCISSKLTHLETEILSVAGSLPRVGLLAGAFVKFQSQTISVPEAMQRSLQDGCSSNTSHIWQLQQCSTT